MKKCPITERVRNLENQKWMQIFLQTCRIPTQAFGSSCADGLYQVLCLGLEWQVWLQPRLISVECKVFFSVVIIINLNSYFRFISFCEIDVKSPWNSLRWFWETRISFHLHGGHITSKKSSQTTLNHIYECNEMNKMKICNMLWMISFIVGWYSENF